MSLLKITTNVDNMVSNLTALADNINGAEYGLAREAFRDIAGMLRASLQENFLAQDFVPPSEATLDYERRKGLDTRGLFSSGAAFRNLRTASGSTWAKAMRGEEWYIFLHDRGVGYSYWSVDGRGGGRALPGRKGRKKGAWRTRARAGTRWREGNAGVTRFPERHAFFINSGAESSILSRIDLFLQSACDEVSSGAA